MSASDRAPAIRLVIETSRPTSLDVAVRVAFREAIFRMNSTLTAGHSPLAAGLLLERELYSLVTSCDSQPTTLLQTSLVSLFSPVERAALTPPARYWLFVLEQLGVQSFLGYLAEDVMLLTGRQFAHA